MQETIKTARFLAFFLLSLLFVCQENCTEKTIGKNDHWQRSGFIFIIYILSKMTHDAQYLNTSGKHLSAMHIARTIVLENDHSFRFTYKQNAF